jgi:hypothetical protein
MNRNKSIMTRLICMTLMLFLFAAGCAAMNPTPNPLDTRPSDFNLVYEWHEGSLPPPYHYEYTITLGPDGQGQIEMLPDYASDRTPHWTETFSVTPAAFDQFYRLLSDKGLFTQRWQAMSDTPVGGGSESLLVTAHGRQISIPPYVILLQTAAAEDMATATRALVPQSLWDKLNMQREQYMQERSN